MNYLSSCLLVIAKGKKPNPINAFCVYVSEGFVCVNFIQFAKIFERRKKTIGEKPNIPGAMNVISWGADGQESGCQQAEKLRQVRYKVLLY